MEKFTLGVVLGAMGGALLVANSYKARVLVKKGQDEIKQKLDDMIDAKLEKMEGPTLNADKADSPKKQADK